MQIYCDGSANPNPGPCGYAIVVLKQSSKYLEIYQFLGQGTNQIAEMIGLRQALRFAGSRDAVIYTDSEWVINICSGKWKANYYQQTWQEIKSLKRKNHQLVWVKAHDKNKYNEEADLLAKKAVNSKSSAWTYLNQHNSSDQIQGEKYWKQHLSKSEQMNKIRASRIDSKAAEKQNNNKFYFKNKFHKYKKRQQTSKQKSFKKYNKPIAKK